MLQISKSNPFLSLSSSRVFILIFFKKLDRIPSFISWKKKTEKKVKKRKKKKRKPNFPISSLRHHSVVILFNSTTSATKSQQQHPKHHSHSSSSSSNPESWHHSLIHRHQQHLYFLGSDVMCELQFLHRHNNPIGMLHRNIQISST